jgi:tetratricopeptide (TPR) repeat protein
MALAVPVAAQAPVKSPAERMADSLLKAGNAAAALTAYQQVAAADSTNLRAWYGIGAAADALHQPAVAAPAFERAARNGTNSIAMYNAGAEHARMGHANTALDWLDKAVTAGFPAPGLFVTDSDLVSLHGNPRFEAIAKRAKIPPAPCMTNADARRFDFWIGEWDVTPASAPTTVVGHNSVQRIAGGCALLENWTAANGTDGKSLNTYNSALGHWEQFWVGSGGAVTEYRDSEWHDGTLVYLAHSSSPQGPFLQRLSFSALDANTVRQFGEYSTDNGATWTVGYDFRYHRTH